MAPPKEKDFPRGSIIATTPSKAVTIKMQTRPLPAAVTQYLICNSLAIKRMHKEQKEREMAARNESTGGVEAQGEEGGLVKDGVQNGDAADGDKVESERKEAGGSTEGDEKTESPAAAAGVTTSTSTSTEAAKGDLDENDALLEAHQARVLTVEEFKKGLQEVFERESPPNEREVWAGVVDNIAAFGPRRIGPNMLVDNTGTGIFRHLYGWLPCPFFFFFSVTLHISLTHLTFQPQREPYPHSNQPQLFCSTYT